MNDFTIKEQGYKGCDHIQEMNKSYPLTNDDITQHIKCFLEPKLIEQVKASKATDAYVYFTENKHLMIFIQMKQLPHNTYSEESLRQFERTLSEYDIYKLPTAELKTINTRLYNLRATDLIVNCKYIPFTSIDKVDVKLLVDCDLSSNDFITDEYLQNTYEKILKLIRK